MLTDSNNCRAFDTTVVSQPSQISIADSIVNADCYQAATGDIYLTVTGGSPAYNYLWSNQSTAANLTNIVGGQYSVTVSDTKNCSVTAGFNVEQGTQIFATVANYDPVCHGGSTGALTAQVNGGRQPYRYVWSTNPADTTVSANRLPAGTYVVTVTDFLGCAVTATGTLSQPDSITVTSLAIGAKCINTASGAVIASVTGGTPPFNFLLNGTGQASDSFANLLPGSYEIVATDVNGCQGTNNFIVHSPGPITVTLSVADQVILTGMQTQLIANGVSDSSPITHYFWSPLTIDSVSVFDFSGCNDSTDCSTPYVSPPFTTTFTVTVENADSCFAHDTVTVVVNKDRVTFIPTAFTPNGDGLNDRFTFAILGASTIEVSVFDRWGERIFYDPAQPNGISNSYGWDGTRNGKLEPNDSYTYQLKITYYDGSVESKTGTVTIMR